LTKNSIKVFNTLYTTFKEMKIPWDLEYSSIDSVKLMTIGNKIYIIDGLKLLIFNFDNNEKKKIDLKKILQLNNLFCGRHVCPFFYHSILKYDDILYNEICDVYQKDENLQIIKINNNKFSKDNDILKNLKLELIREKLKNLSEFKPDISVVAVSKKYILTLIDNEEFYLIVKLWKKNLTIKQKIKIFKKSEKIKLLISKKFEYNSGKLYYLYYYTKDEVKFKIYDIKM